MNRPQVYAVIAGLAALTAAVTAAGRRRKHSALPAEKKLRALPPLEGEHVGVEGWDWPMRDRFSTPGTFQRTLQCLGYEVPRDGEVLGEKTQAAVSAFQFDFNVVTAHEYLGAPVDESGLICEKTVQAIAAASDHQRELDQDWFEIVGDALKAARPEVG